MRLYCDNKATINIAHNPIYHDRTKHVEIVMHFIKEKVDVGKACIVYALQAANVFTKGLFNDKFDTLINKLSMINIYDPT